MGIKERGGKTSSPEQVHGQRISHTHTNERVGVCAASTKASFSSTNSGADKAVCVFGRHLEKIAAAAMRRHWALLGLLFYSSYTQDEPPKATPYLIYTQQVDLTFQKKRDWNTSIGSPLTEKPPTWFPVPSGCLKTPAMGEWTILERLLEAAVQQHSTMIGRWVGVGVQQVTVVKFELRWRWTCSCLLLSLCACLYVCVYTPCSIEMTSWNMQYTIPSLSEI